MARRVAQLEDQSGRDKQYYESRIRELEGKLLQFAGVRSFGLQKVIIFIQAGPSHGGGNQSGKNQELEEINENLNAQISEYNKLIKRLYENGVTVSEFMWAGIQYIQDPDTEKKRMLEDIKTLRSLSSIKQDRIERLEAKVKTMSS